MPSATTASVLTDAFWFSAVPYCCELVVCFHGGNTGSNPVGDAIRINNLSQHPHPTLNSGDSVVTN